MIYFYLLSWLSMLIQAIGITLSIGAGLLYLAELVEEYVTVAKKVINYVITIDTILAVGLLIFEDLPIKIVLLAIFSNILYFISVRDFPIINISSVSFILSFVLFLVHNYLAFDYFVNNYYQFTQVLTYMLIFCWLVPIGLLVSCSANDNVLPTHSNSQSTSSSSYNGEFVTNYLKSKNKKVGLLSLMRYFQENYLPQTQSRKPY